MTQSRFRIGGAYTRLQWTSPGSKTQQTLAYVDIINETAPRYVAAPQAIQPLDQEYPIEIAFPGALEAGSLEVTFREQWNVEVWEAFYSTYKTSTGVEPISDLLGIFKAQLQAGPSSGISLTKIIVDPTTGNTVRQINYVNPVIVNVMIDERVNIGQMTFPKSVQFMYTQRKEIFAFGNDGTGAPTSGSMLPIANFQDQGNYGG